MENLTFEFWLAVMYSILITVLMVILLKQRKKDIYAYIDGKGKIFTKNVNVALASAAAQNAERFYAIENQEDVLGECLVLSIHSRIKNHYMWEDFSKSDIDDQVNGRIKINGTWHKKEDVIFYDELLLGPKKKEIKNRLKGKV